MQRLLALLLVALPIAGCSVAPGAGSPGTGASASASPAPAASQAASPSSPTPPPSPSGTPPAGLAGREFLSTEVRGHELVAGTRIRLTFDNANIGAQAGCNSLFGSYSLDGDALVVNQMGSTEMGCQPELMAQDSWLADFLASRPRLTLAGNELVLASDSVSIRLLDREVAQPDQPLVGITWGLTSIISGDSVSSVPFGITPSIMFAADGRVQVETGCNAGGGHYAVDGDQVHFGAIVMTDMACRGGAGEVDQAFRSVLSADSVSYSIDADSLTLQAGDAGLQFSAAVDVSD